MVNANSNPSFFIFLALDEKNWRIISLREKKWLRLMRILLMARAPFVPPSNEATGGWISGSPISGSSEDRRGNPPQILYHSHLSRGGKLPFVILILVDAEEKKSLSLRLEISRPNKSVSISGLVIWCHFWEGWSYYGCDFAGNTGYMKWDRVIKTET